MSDNKISYYNACAQALGPIGSLLEDLPDKFPVEILQLIRCYVDDWTMYEGRLYFCGIARQDKHDGIVIYLRDPATGRVEFGGLYGVETIPRVLTDEFFTPVCWTNAALNQGGFYAGETDEVEIDHDTQVKLASVSMFIRDATSDSPPTMYVRDVDSVHYLQLTDSGLTQRGFFINAEIDELICLGSYFVWRGCFAEIDAEQKSVTLRQWNDDVRPRMWMETKVRLVEGERGDGAHLDVRFQDAPGHSTYVEKSADGKWICPSTRRDFQTEFDATFSGISTDTLRSIWAMVHRIFTGDNYQKIRTYFLGRLHVNPSDLLEGDQLCFPKLERVLLSVIA
jgi:hypothetical protein